MPFVENSMIFPISHRHLGELLLSAGSTWSNNGQQKSFIFELKLINLI